MSFILDELLQREIQRRMHDALNDYSRLSDAVWTKHHQILELGLAANFVVRHALQYEYGGIEYSQDELYREYIKWLMNDKHPPYIEAFKTLIMADVLGRRDVE